ncbi:hypothetical protein ColLi_11951 [Colletotrichum liriopes]|uniref:Uncharacterized protein n=1 Tax=Colletotrichum liriopes TaxID=708192 RepID=A0AA37LZ54_9PEZI|nr:hypothetical protein ColLi_11951 [Colletotrichum liriopes]
MAMQPASDVVEITEGDGTMLMLILTSRIRLGVQWRREVKFGKEDLPDRQTRRSSRCQTTQKQFEGDDDGSTDSRRRSPGPCFQRPTLER